MPRRPKKQTRDAEATKAAFIRAGEKVFAQSGFDGATLDMLASEAGANKALVSYYFGSKEGLYDAVIASIVGDVVSTVTDELTEDRDPVKNFQRYIRVLARVIGERPTFPSILFREYIDGSMQEREAPFRQVVQLFRMTHSLYEAGRKAKAFRNVDPHLLHLSIVGPIIHFVVAARARAKTLHLLRGEIKDADIDAFARHHEKIILAGIRRGER